MNLAGAGDIFTITKFTRELRKNCTLCVLYDLSYFSLAPDTAPRNFSAVRLSGSIIEMLWIPLTLSEARGFVISYTASYGQQLATSNETIQPQEQIETGIQSNVATVTRLQEDATYLVQVWANTAAGAGKRSPVVILQPPTDANSYNLVAIVGGSVSAIFILAIVILAVAIIAKLKKRKKNTGYVCLGKYKMSDINNLV